MIPPCPDPVEGPGDERSSLSQFLLSFSSWLLILVRSGCCLVSCAINETPQHSRPNAKNKPLILFETTESELTSSVSFIHAQNVYFKQC